jgi:hypothetical protein
MRCWLRYSGGPLEARRKIGDEIARILDPHGYPQ